MKEKKSLDNFQEDQKAYDELQEKERIFLKKLDNELKYRILIISSITLLLGFFMFISVINISGGSIFLQTIALFISSGLIILSLKWIYEATKK